MGWNILYTNSIQFVAYNLTISVSMPTGGSQFSLFITVIVVFTFIALFGGIILFALATDWFDVSGLISVFGTVWKIFLDYPNVRSYVFQLFFCPSGIVLDILPWHGDNTLFLQTFHSGETCCSVTACSQ